MTEAELIRAARSRHGLTQQSLARRARTTQRHISRIERGEVSPTMATLRRLLAAMGEGVDLVPFPGPSDNRTDEELRTDYRQLSSEQRLTRSSSLSRTLTSIAAQARR